MRVSLFVEVATMIRGKRDVILWVSIMRSQAAQKSRILIGRIGDNTAQ